MYICIVLKYLVFIISLVLCEIEQDEVKNTIKWLGESVLFPFRASPTISQPILKNYTRKKSGRFNIFGRSGRRLSSATNDGDDIRRRKLNNRYTELHHDLGRPEINSIVPQNDRMTYNYRTI
jgi:hypothetical protein